MKPLPVTLPSHCRQRVDPELATCIVGVGNVNLLTEPLLALIASRECPGHVFLEIVERVPQWIQTKKVIISGFHSPLEQQVLRSLLRRKGRAIKVLARSFAHESADYRPTPEEREALNSGQMLVITAFPPTVTRITRATALERNRLVLALAQEHYIPCLSAQSPLRSFLTNRDQEHAQEA